MASLAPREIPRGRPPWIFQESKISYILYKLDKFRLLPTNLDPRNTMLPTEKLAKVKNMLKIDVLCLYVFLAVTKNSNSEHVTLQCNLKLIYLIFYISHSKKIEIRDAH
eukprot:sb/3477383/